MGFTYIDAAVILLYLVGVAWFGVLMGGRQTSVRDFFISDKALPWWTICITIVATETSAITFLSLPGLAYLGNFNFLQLAFGYVAGRILVSYLLIPRYYAGQISTAYEFLGRTFDGNIRRLASAVFMLTRTFADGVRLYTTAIPLALLLKEFSFLSDFSNHAFYALSISALTLLTLVYVFKGGIRAVIWADVVQWFIYLFGAVVSIIILLDLLPGDFFSICGTALNDGKLALFNWGFGEGPAAFFTNPYTTIASIIGGMFLSMASHGTDQLIVQRVLAAGSRSSAQKAMVLSGVIIIIQFALFLFVGTLLHYYYRDTGISPNEVFSRFIIEALPTGISGLIVAGVLAAAMSTLSSSISALSSATVLDFILPLRKRTLLPVENLRLSRLVSLAWALILLMSAMLFVGTPAVVVELALSIASYVYGALLGLFLLAIVGNYSSRAAAAGFLAGIVGNALVIAFTPIAWTWYTVIGTTLTIAVATLFRFTWDLPRTTRKNLKDSAQSLKDSAQSLKDGEHGGD